MSNVKKAFKSKSREINEINQDYANVAGQFAHKSVVITELNEQIEKLTKEIQAHLDEMLRLRKEAQQIPQPPQPVPPEEPLPAAAQKEEFKEQPNEQ